MSADFFLGDFGLSRTISAAFSPGVYGPSWSLPQTSSLFTRTRRFLKKSRCCLYSVIRQTPSPPIVHHKGPFAYKRKFKLRHLPDRGGGGHGRRRGQGQSRKPRQVALAPAMPSGRDRDRASRTCG